MPAKDVIGKAMEALLSDIDLPAAEKTLDELGLEVAYSDEAVGVINAAADTLGDQAATLKKREAPRAERKAVREKIDLLVNARALLYRLRPAQPGDVVAGVGPVGGVSGEAN